MTKLIKYLLFLAIGITAFAALLLVILFTVIDPNRYKPALERVVANNTDYRMQIAGDINWSFRPVFGLSINDLRLSNNITPQELASFSEVSLKLSPMALLGGNLVMQEFLARNLHVNWYVDEQGQVNWLPDTGTDIGSNGSPQASAPPQAQAESSDIPVSIDIEQITISNASLSIRDVQQGINTSFQNLDISSRNTNLDNRPFPFSVSTRIVDHSGNRNLAVNLESMAQVDFAAGNILLDDFRLNLSPLVLQGRLAVSNFHDQAAWQGELSSNTFNLSYLLENFIDLDAGQGVDMSIDMSSNQFNIALAFNGDSRGATLSDLQLGLDDMQLSLSGDLLYAEGDRPMNIAYQLQANALDLDAFLPAGVEETDETSATGDEELPFDTLNGMNVRGNHTIESLRIAGLQFDNIDADLQLQDGLLDLQTMPIGFLGGELAGRIQVNGASAPAVIDTRFTMENINAESLAENLRMMEPFTGRLNVDAEHSLRGDTSNELMSSLAGLTRFSISEGSADISLVKRVFETIAVISPSGDMAAQWPDVVQFSDITGQHLFAEGINDGQELALRLDNLDISGTGGINLTESAFDYRLDFTILGEPAPQTIRINEDYRDIAWPVRCNATFDSSPAQICSPDMQRVRELFAQIARDEVERRARDAVSEQTERLEERARGLLDRLRR